MGSEYYEKDEAYTETKEDALDRVNKKYLESIDEAFTYHPPKTEATKQKHTDLREAAKALAIYIVETVPHSGERDVALDKLREVMMWSMQGIALHE